jgi:hypothetical protein
MRFLRSMCFGGLTALTCAATTARASDVEVTSDTTSQFYDVRSPTGETVLARRRLTTTLGVGAYDLLDRPADAPLGPELSFRARVRYDADYGANPGETDPTNYARFVPGYQNELVDLMYGYVEGRRFLKGWLGFKVGRQYVTDSLGWWSFDGGEVKVTTPYYFAVEGYGGLEVRGGMPLSSPQFERDGIWRGNRSGFDPSLYPSFQPSDIAPAIGFAAESTGVTWLHARLTYRRVLDTGQSNVSEFSSGLTSPGLYSGARVSQERIGYSVDADWSTYGSVRAGLAYDLYDQKMSSVYATIDAFATKKLTLSLDYDFFQPTYDADSIWNFFASEPMNDIGLRATLNPTDRLSISAHAHVRIYDIATSPINGDGYLNVGTSANAYYPTNGHPFDDGAGFSARYRFGGTLIGARADGNFGDAGDRVGGDVFAEKTFETHYFATGRLSLWQWDDKLRPDRDATSFGYVAGVGYIFAPRARASVNFDDNMNRLVGQQFRVMLTLSIAVTK